jgi:2-amino-4-hydroxy-6-hydroxymethyldihydropteridine diphosphokinase
MVEMECALTPRQLLAILNQIEIDLGRTPGEKWGPRPIDLDIVLWEGRTVAEVELQIPHLELHRRRFVLEPLCELNPEALHPIIGKTVRELLNGVLRQDVVRLNSPDWPEATSGGTD